MFQASGADTSATEPLVPVERFESQAAQGISLFAPARNVDMIRSLIALESLMRHTSYLIVFSMATLFVFTSCGDGGTHLPPSCDGASNACPAHSFVYVTTEANEVLIFPVSQTGTLGSSSSVPGPAITAGSIAVSAKSGELFVADHVQKTVSAFINANNQYAPAPGSPYSTGAFGFLGAVAATPNGQFVYVIDTGGAVIGFSIASDGSLAPVPGSPVAVTAGSVDALVDTSSNFLFVISGSSISVFSISSSLYHQQPGWYDLGIHLGQEHGRIDRDKWLTI